MPVLSAPFTVFSFADTADADVKCSYGPGGQVAISTRDTDVRATLAGFTTLSRAALSADDSLSMIGDLASKYR